MGSPQAAVRLHHGPRHDPAVVGVHLRQHGVLHERIEAGDQRLRLPGRQAVQERLGQQIRTLESENRALREDLGFFEKLTAANGTEAVAIRGLQAEVLGGTQLKWQVLVMQPVKNAPEFHGKLEMSIGGTLEGRPWMLDLPAGGVQPLQFRQYRRIEGMVDLPPQAVVKNVSAKVMEGAATRAVQSIKL